MSAFGQIKEWHNCIINSTDKLLAVGVFKVLGQWIEKYSSPIRTPVLFSNSQKKEVEKSK